MPHDSGEVGGDITGPSPALRGCIPNCTTFRDSPPLRGAEASSQSQAPPPTDSMVVNSDEMRVLLQHRK